MVSGSPRPPLRRCHAAWSLRFRGVVWVLAWLPWGRVRLFGVMASGKGRIWFPLFPPGPFPHSPVGSRLPGERHLASFFLSEEGISCPGLLVIGPGYPAQRRTHGWAPRGCQVDVSSGGKTRPSQPRSPPSPPRKAITHGGLSAARPYPSQCGQVSSVCHQHPKDRPPPPSSKSSALWSCGLAGSRP